VLRTQAYLAVEAWARLLRAHAVTTRTLSAELVAEHGLTLNDYEALLLLSRGHEGRMRRVDLAEGLVLTASGVTRLLDGLERVRLVERASCAEDRRVVYAVLTEAGRERLRTASESHLAGIRALFESRLDADELAQLASLLGRLPGAEDADGADCAAE
jgi:DNA-binding MarR family transcriptional regulator